MVVAECEDVLRIPEPEGSVVYFMMAEDRHYFEGHPKAQFQIVPGVRIRRLFREGIQPEKTVVKLVKDLRRAYRNGQLKR
jgi:hypothetical protein